VITIFCKNCGKEIDDKASVCVNCGVSVIQPNQSLDKSRITAGIFALLLGGLGVHKFYMGKIGMGILYLVFCWTFVPSIVGFIEGIVFLTESDESFAKKL